ncbi:MAG: MFS transporter [Pseudomonadales bacterium]|nr:MFS transporter [Pseudomonadales bacterium]
MLAWSIVALLLLASLVSFIDRQVVAIVVDPMKADLAISDSEIGWLYGVFSVFYAVAALPLAWVADNRNRTKLIAIGIGFWSLMTTCCGLAQNFWQVLLARMGVGIGEATLTPTTNSLLGDYFPPERLPLAFSIYQLGPILGSGLAFVIGGFVLGLVNNLEPLTLPLVGTLHPWQQTFLYLGAPGLLLAAVFVILREPERRTAPHATRMEFGEVWRFYRENPMTLMCHHFGFLFINLMGYAFVFWTVSYFVRVHHMEAAAASVTFGWLFASFGAVGPLVVAMLAQHLQRRGHDDANITAGMIGGALAIPAILAVQFAPTPTVAFLLYAPALLFINSPFGVANGALPVIAPPTIRAQVAALNMLIGSFGMMLGPPLAGYFNTHLFPGDDGVRYSIMTMVSIFGLLGTVLLWLGRKPYAASLRRARERWSDY